MRTVYLLVTLVAALASACVAIANFLRLRFVRKQAAQLRVPEAWIPILGVLQAAAAAGLLLGLAGVQWVGAAAAAGLVLYFVGAIVMHRRAGDKAIGPAIGMLVLAAATLVLTMLTTDA